MNFYKSHNNNCYYKYYFFVISLFYNSYNNLNNICTVKKIFSNFCKKKNESNFEILVWKKIKDKRKIVEK